MSIKVSKIHIKNILGIEECTFEAGQFTTISGKNATGKSSIMKALQAVFKGGHDATLLRNGATVGEVVFEMSDGTNVTKKVTKEKSEIKATGQKFGQTYINGISDLTSVNPISFLAGDAKTKLKILLESMPIELPIDKLTEIMETVGEEVPRGEPLQVLDTARKIVFDARTGTNRVIKEKRHTINQLESTLSPGAEKTDIAEQLAIAEEEQRSITKRFEDALQIARDEIQAEVDRVKAEGAARIEELQKGRTEYCEPLVAQIATLRQAVTHEALAANTRTMIADHKEELANFEDEAVKQNDALDAIDKMKLDIFSNPNNTPFKNLVVQDGQIYIGGVHFEQLNTASQVAFAIKLAKLRAGELGFICLDGMEALDADKLTQFKLAAQKTDYQYIITRVADTDLTITNE